jgi:hypothetical protein
MYVQQVIKDLHSKKVSNLFIKLDIFKAFDTVNWSYLLDIMSFWGGLAQDGEAGLLPFGQHPLQPFF